jgi:DNA-binding CsgD family transcriptional regulator
VTFYEVGGSGAHCLPGFAWVVGGAGNAGRGQGMVTTSDSGGVSRRARGEFTGWAASGPPGAVSGGSRVGRGWRLVGRDEELRLVEAALRRGDRARGIVLAGAAGVGKTRLAREVLAGVERPGLLTRWVSATESARGLPLGAFASLVGDVAGADARVLARAADAVLAGAGRAGVVIGVDDAHLLDELSAALVHRLVLDDAASMVLTVRGGEAAPDAVTALWKDGYLDRLEVRPLSEPETVALLESVLGGPLGSASAARLYSLTRGNALYLRHLVDGELAEGRLRQTDGVWQWHGGAAVPTGLTELVEARMGQLSEPVGEVVDMLALAEPLDVELLGRLTEPSAVERTEATGLIGVELDGRRPRARLAHPLYGEVRRARIGRLRARRLRGRVATALADTGRERAEDSLRRAVLTLDSDLPPDPELFLAAANQAIAVLDVRLAERLARAATQAGGGFQARLILASVLSWLGRGMESDAELAALSGLPCEDAQRAGLALTRAGNLFFAGRRPGEADEVLREAESLVSDPDARCVLLAMRSAFHAYAGRSAAAVRAATQALTSPSLPDLALVVTAYGLVGGLGAMGQADRMEAAATRGITAAARSFAAAAPSWGLCDLHMLGLRFAGYLDRAEDVARAWHQRNMLAPIPAGMGVALLGYAAAYRGQPRTAIRLLRESEAVLGSVGAQAHTYRNLINLTHALAMAGEVGEARRVLAEVEHDPHPSLTLVEPDVVLARGWVAASEGAVSEGITLAREAAELAEAREQWAYEVLALHTAVRFGDRTAAGRLAELADQVDGPRASAAAVHAAALAAEDPDGLLAASERFEEMGDLLAALDAAAHAHAASRRRGDRAWARGAAGRAERLAEAAEAARTPAYLAVARPLPLTDREREIVNLAARGWTNRQIADRLVVSVRTVEGHLYRASAKLGVSDRTQLGDILS